MAFFNLFSYSEFPSLVVSGVDWVETDEAHVLKIEAPGFAKEDIKIKLHASNMLEISGEPQQEQEEQQQQQQLFYHCKERAAHGGFAHRFLLPESANLEGIKAQLLNGLLTVTVPKIKPLNVHID